MKSSDAAKGRNAGSGRIGTLMRQLRLLTIISAAALSVGAASPEPRPPAFVNLATPFEQVAVATNGEPAAARIAAVRRKLNSLLPGLYPDGVNTDRRIAQALVDWSDKRAGYDRIVSEFPRALAQATARFRTVFPNFSSPLPIYLYHSLGMRDGGSDYLEPGHRPVMLFGADMIAELHADSSLEPFFDHELFHLENARAFPDCDQFWCGLWQEGLAVDAANAMTANATDHQLLLDVPKAIRGPTEAHWAEALCFVAVNFDDPKQVTTATALQMGSKPPSGLPERFGYYVGFRVAQATGRTVPALAKLDHEAARPVLRTALMRLMKSAKADCAPPPLHATLTRNAPHPV